MTKPKWVESYTMRVGETPTIDGRPFPWDIALHPGPMVQELHTDGDLGPAGPLIGHILWLPLYVRGPMPTPPVGTPDARQLVDSADESGSPVAAPEGGA